MKVNNMNPTDPVSFFGWVENPHEVEAQLKTMPMPMAAGNVPEANEDKEILLSDIARKVLGRDMPKGPQKIGDCVSWGWSNAINYLQVIDVFNQLKAANLLDLPDKAMFGGTEAEFEELELKRATIFKEYQEIATEATYAFSRVEVGGQRGSMSDGSVGAWAAKAATKFGYLSRNYLKSKGISPDYDPKRAKQWGAYGVPDELEPEAAVRICKNTSMVTSYKDAKALINNGYPIPVCSNQGFTMSRDGQGFCKPQGVWYHCMLLFGTRNDRPGCCCSQSWGPNTPDGPTDRGQPDNTFWVDAQVIDKMLSQRDSFAPSQFVGFPAQDLVDWRH